jgi:hypothetical protein
VRLKIVRTYDGWLEGSPQAISQAILQSLPKHAAILLPPAYPLVIISPSPGDLPQWLCVVELQSAQGINYALPDCNSRLYVCCLMANTAWIIDEMMEWILRQIDWEGSAQDYDIMDF